MSGFETARFLADSIGVRFSGTDAEVRAGNYVAEQLANLHYEVKKQPFRFLGWEVTEPAELTFLEPEHISIPIYPFVWSGSTPPEGVVGCIEPAGRINIIELFEWDRFALIDDRTGEEVAYLAARDDGPTVAMPLSIPTFTAPTVAIGRDEYALMRTWMQAGQSVRARLKVATRFNPDAQSANYIASLSGTGKLPAIVLCAHYDTEYNTPGGYDNASGMGLVVEVAARLRGKTFRRPVHFIAFGAEEYLFVGSAFYVQGLKQRGQLGGIGAVVNIDSILISDKRDSLLGGAVVHHTEDAFELASRIATIVESAGVTASYKISYASPPSPSSDHAPFVREGIPAVKLFDAAPIWFHTPFDTFDRIDPDAWELATRCVQQLIEELADMPGGKEGR